MIHKWGCTCKSCTKTNATCPECGTHYWNEPDMPEYEECHKCGWTPFKQAELVGEAIVDDAGVEC